MFPISYLLVQFFLCGFFGFFVEGLLSALSAAIKERSFSLTVNVSVWLVLVYGLVSFFYPPLHELTGEHQWYIRGVCYMLSFYIVRYISGWLLMKLTGDYIWRYSSKFSLHGLIRLSNAPFWFFGGLGFERIYPYIVKMSRFLSS